MGWLENKKKREALGQRGKDAEKIVQAVLKQLSDKYESFDFERQYDARSAGGRFPAQTGDYAWFNDQPGRGHGVIEVKEVAHDFRLPAKNFPADQRAMLRKRALAGGLVMVLVHHTTTKRWRAVYLDFFEPKVASWDFSSVTSYATAKAAIAATRQINLEELNDGEKVCQPD